jgi:hypothetical protein
MIGRPAGIGARAVVLLPLLLLLPASAPGQSSSLRIDSRPKVVIGASADDPNDQLGRVVEADRMGDGTIVILDALFKTVRLYSAAGRHVIDIGREGDGPGEFADPISLELLGDTIVVIDASGRRSWFGRDGTVLRADRVVAEPVCDERYNARPGGLLPDGRLLVRCEERLFGRVTGEYRATVGLSREQADGSFVSLGVFPADTGRTDPKGVAVPRPYLPRTELLWAAAGERVFVASADRPEVRVLAPGSPPRQPVMLAASRRSVTKEDIEREVAAMLQYVVKGNDRRVVEEWARGMPPAARTPAIRRLVAESPDEFWAETWDAADDGSWWLVVDLGDGQPTRVRTPPGISLLAVGDDWILGLRRDEYGAEHVQLHALKRD